MDLHFSHRCTCELGLHRQRTKRVTHNKSQTKHGGLANSCPYYTSLFYVFLYLPQRIGRDQWSTPLTSGASTCRNRLDQVLFFCVCSRRMVPSSLNSFRGLTWGLVLINGGFDTDSSGKPTWAPTSLPTARGTRLGAPSGRRNSVRLAQICTRVQSLAHTMDEIHFAPKKPWNVDSPVNANQTWFLMVSIWCEMDFVHPQYLVYPDMRNNQGPVA